MKDAFFEYVDDLLRLQSEAVAIHEHKGVLGHAREDFLKQQLSACVNGLCLHTGEVFWDNKSLGQHDIIIRKQDTLNTELGGQICIQVRDCAGIIEVKSNATGTDFRALNRKAHQMKEVNPDVIVGLFCYKLALQKKTILGRFGYMFDRDNQAYILNERSIADYRDLDFVVCLDENDENGYAKYFLIIYDKSYDHFTLELSPPFSGKFFSTVSRIHSQ